MESPKKDFRITKMIRSNEETRSLVNWASPLLEGVVHPQISFKGARESSCDFIYLEPCLMMH